MSYETILVDNADGVSTITLNRPERLNAWTFQMGAELSQAIEAGNEDDDVLAFVVTGQGRAFCAGADIGDVFKARADGKSGNSVDNNRDWVNDVRNAKPMVAAINGAAVGVGLTQILPMDYLIAAEDAPLSVRFIKMGVVPELASSHYLVLRMGFGAASEMMLSGRTVSGRDAFELGLVDRCVAAGDLIATAREVALGMGDNPQSALKAIKKLVTQNAAETDLALVQKRELAALAQAYKTPEHKEAVAAFMEKRQPDFKGARNRKA